MIDYNKIVERLDIVSQEFENKGFKDLSFELDEISQSLLTEKDAENSGDDIDSIKESVFFWVDQLRKDHKDFGDLSFVKRYLNKKVGDKKALASLRLLDSLDEKKYAVLISEYVTACHKGSYATIDNSKVHPAALHMWGNRASFNESDE